MATNTITLDDVKAATTEVIGIYIPNPSDQAVCAKATWDNRAEGFPKAFNAAIGDIGLDPELVKKLVKQFQAELPEASRARRQREEEDRKAAEKAADEAKRAAEEQKIRDLRDEIKGDLDSLATIQRNGTELQGKIGTIARSARDLARKYNDPAVVAALETVTEVLDETKDLVEKMDKLVRDAQDDGRKDDLAAVKIAVKKAGGIYDRLQQLHDPEAKDAHDAVKTAVDEVKDRKDEVEKQAAIQKAVDDAAKDLQATEQVAQDLQKGISAYKLAYLDLHGEELAIDATDLDNVDKLMERANQAVTDAKEANSRVATAATAKNQAAAETAAGEVKTERDKAQKELNKLNQKAEALNQAKALRDTRKLVKVRKEEDDKEKKSKSFFSRAIGPRLFTIVGLAAAFVLTLLAQAMGLSKPFVVIMVVLVLSTAVFTAIAPPSGSRVIAGMLAAVALGAVIWLGFYGDTAGTIGSRSYIQTPTPRSQQEGVATFQAGFTPWPGTPTPED